MSLEKVYVFSGTDSIYPSGVFTEKDIAINWIEKNKLSGTLNTFPLNTGLYDWAINNEYFTVKKDHQKSPSFIQKFTCAALEHYHFEDGSLM